MSSHEAEKLLGKIHREGDDDEVSTSAILLRALAFEQMKGRIELEKLREKYFNENAVPSSRDNGTLLSTPTGGMNSSNVLTQQHNLLSRAPLQHPFLNHPSTISGVGVNQSHLYPVVPFAKQDQQIPLWLNGFLLNAATNKSTNERFPFIDSMRK